MTRLSVLEDFVWERVGQALDEAYYAGACPDELLAAVAVVYLRSVQDYGKAGEVGAPLQVAQQFHRAMYVEPEVV